jgi:multidrug transporter EmrE-like cation transporter
VPRPTKQAPPPLQVDTARVVVTGIALWAVALVVVLFLGERVDRLWTWTCVAAIGLGCLGLGVMRLQGQLPRRRAEPDVDVHDPS